MIIKTITRVVPDGNYGNISASADLEEGDKLEESYKKLDSDLRKSLIKMSEQYAQTVKSKGEISKSVSILESAIQHAKKNYGDLPF